MEVEQQVDGWASHTAPLTQRHPAHGVYRPSKTNDIVQKHDADVGRYLCGTLDSLLSTQASADDLPEVVDTDPHEAEDWFIDECKVGISPPQAQKIVFRSANYWGIQALNAFGYDPQQFLDNGGMAMIRRAKHHESGRIGVLKSIRRENGRDMIRAQYSLLLTVRHRNIICPDVLLETPHDTWMSMEFCEDGDLCAYVRLHGSFANARAHSLFMQLVSSVDFLHQHGIAHRNITPSNLLLMKEATHLKVGGFGQAIYGGVPLCGKSKQTDLCACGGILYFMSYGQVLSETNRVD